MSTESPEPNRDAPKGPFTLTPARIVLLILGALLVLYTVSAFMGSLTNYQMLKEGAQAQKAPVSTSQ
jgi:hypothetical protein